MKYLITIVLIFLMPTLAGCGGSQGEKGEKGEAGAPGVNGTSDMSVQSDTKCQTVNPGLGMGFTYEVLTFTGGNKFVTCGVYNNTGEYSATHFWAKNQSGNTQATCLVLGDADAPSAGYWEFTTTSTRQVKYHDSSSVNDGVITTLTTCTTI
jgi:hypothetical protein